MLKKSMRYALTLIISALLAACAGLSPTVKSNTQTLNTHQIAKMAGWQLTGRFAYREMATNNGFTAAIVWDQQHLPLQQTHMTITGPLSLWHAHFIATNKDATLMLSDGKVFHAASIEALLRANVAWYLPVTALNSWLFALPEPGSHATLKRNEAGEVTTLIQSGWTIDYSAYQVISGYRLPKRLTLTKGPLQLKLAIEQWNVTL